LKGFDSIDIKPIINLLLQHFVMMLYNWRSLVQMGSSTLLLFHQGTWWTQYQIFRWNIHESYYVWCFWDIDHQISFWSHSHHHP